MSDYSAPGALVEEIKQASETIAESDCRMAERLDGIEKSVNELYRKTARPGWGGGHDDDADERRTQRSFQPASLRTMSQARWRLRTRCSHAGA
jgi:hypothetical protein